VPTKKRLSVDNRQPHGTTHRSAVDWEALLARIPGGKTVVHYEADTQIFRQGDPADATATTMEASAVTRITNKFKRLGFIKYNGSVCVNSGLLSVLLAHDMSELTK
jgi:hypothetical protein